MSRSLCRVAGPRPPTRLIFQLLEASSPSCAVTCNRPCSSSTRRHCPYQTGPARWRQWPPGHHHLTGSPAAPPAHSPPARRGLHTTAPTRASSGSNGSGPQGGESRTDLGALDVLAGAETPATAVDICLPDGFKLGSGISARGGDGLLLVGGEAFAWRPWECSSGNGNGNGNGARKKMRLINAKGQWEVPEEAFGLLALVWPRPDLLVLGLGPEMRPLSPITRRHISGLGMRIEVLDTRNAAAQFNLLATERGVGDVAAALVPIGWREGVGAA